MTTLQDAMEAIGSLKINPLKKTEEKTRIADELLGKYKGIIPKDKTSTEFIRRLRSTLYGKIK